MPTGYVIDRCICTNRRFAELQEIAKRDNLSLQELTAKTGAGGGCKMCLAYLERMLDTGEVVFHELLFNIGQTRR